MSESDSVSEPPFHSHLQDREYLARYANAIGAAQMPPNDARRARFYQLLEMLKLSRGAAGATLEAGCFRGMASHLMCQQLRSENASFAGERHFLVDSFEGLSKPIKADGNYASKRYEAGAFTGTSVKHVKQTLVDFPKVRAFQGWIPTVFSALPDLRYRFVHIDVDLYEPTRDCLEYFYDRLSRGGILVCDDFGPWPDMKWLGCGKAVREFCDDRKLPFAVLDTGNAVILKR